MYFANNCLTIPKDYPVVLEGIGVHSGNHTKVVLDYYQAWIQKIVFYFPTPSSNCVFIAFAKFADSFGNQTHLVDANGGSSKLHTVEHLLAALAILGVKNAFIRVNSTELPILDGSAWPWVKALAPHVTPYGATTTQHTAVRILKPVRVEVGNAWCELLPLDSNKIQFVASYELDYDHPALGHQVARCVFDNSTPLPVELLSSRTFGFVNQAAEMRMRGLALGAGLENTVLFDENSVINPEGLRYPNEPAQHKLLDAVGDLKLLGDPIIGEFRGYKSGHAMNVQLVKSLLSDKTAYDQVKI